MQYANTQKQEVSIPSLENWQKKGHQEQYANWY